MQQSGPQLLVHPGQTEVNQQPSLIQHSALDDDDLEDKHHKLEKIHQETTIAKQKVEIAKLKVEKAMLKEENLTGEHPDDDIDHAIADAVGDKAAIKEKKAAKVIKAIAKTQEKKAKK
jgi:hypothetical protein